MTTRAKKTVITNVSESDYKDNLANYAKSEAEIRKINADIDLQTSKIREKYQEKLDTLTKTKESSFDIVMQYAEENNQLFDKKRSIETPFGVIGFRLGTPKLKQLKGFTSGSILTLVKRVMPQFIRAKEEVNKEAILADKKLTENELKEVGYEIVQEDSFYIDLKTEEVNQ